MNIWRVQRKNLWVIFLEIEFRMNSAVTLGFDPNKPQAEGTCLANSQKFDTEENPPKVSLSVLKISANPSRWNASKITYKMARFEIFSSLKLNLFLEKKGLGAFKKISGDRIVDLSLLNWNTINTKERCVYNGISSFRRSYLRLFNFLLITFKSLYTFQCNTLK